MDIDFVTRISPEEFSAKYMRANRPVVVKDALADWHLGERWTPAYLSQHFGSEQVQVYNSYFDLRRVMRLERYFAERFGREPEPGVHDVPYVRWYSKFRDVKFFWADDAMARMRDNWSAPYFLPRTDYALPFAPAPRELDPTRDLYPARGIFISERGARTGLHVDPWGSDAVLCQLYGEKSWVMYSPDLTDRLLADGQVVDPDRPDHARFPRFAATAPTYEFRIGPGDAVYVPHGWYHHVRSETDSISLTWNFVHRTTVPALLAWLDGKQSAVNDEVLAFFFAPALGAGASPAACRELVASTFGA